MPSDRAPAADRWQTRFAQVVRQYGVARLARELEIDPSALYQWIRGATAPRPTHAAQIIQLASAQQLELSYADVYAQRAELASAELQAHRC